MKKLILFFLCLIMCVVVSFAHPGGTDSNGGHYNRSTGEYHYHHGYPAHQHTDGLCPYDFDDKTGQSSGSSSNSSTSYKSSPGVKIEYSSNSAIQESRRYPDILDFILDHIFASVVVLILFIICIVIFVKHAIYSHNNRAFIRSGGAQKMARILMLDLYDIRGRRNRCIESLSCILSRNLESLQSNQLIPKKADPFVQLLRQYYHVPADAYISDDGNPSSTIGNGVYGRYTVWLNNRGTIYHCASCYYTSSSRQTSAYGLPASATPCSKCRPILPDMSWVEPYKDALSSLSVFDIHEISPSDL